jgi:hypothetical protein
MSELIEAVISWPCLLIVLLVFGVAPGLVLRSILLVYPKAHPRRRELLGELYKLPHWARPLFVAEQVELMLAEGLPARLQLVRARHAEQPFVRLDEWMRRLRSVLYGTIWCSYSPGVSAGGSHALVVKSSRRTSSLARPHLVEVSR